MIGSLIIASPLTAFVLFTYADLLLRGIGKSISVRLSFKCVVLCFYIYIILALNMIYAIGSDSISIPISTFTLLLTASISVMTAIGYRECLDECYSNWTILYDMWFFRLSIIIDYVLAATNLFHALLDCYLFSMSYLFAVAASIMLAVVMMSVVATMDRNNNVVSDAYNKLIANSVVLRIMVLNIVPVLLVLAIYDMTLLICISLMTFGAQVIYTHFDKLM